MAMGLTEDDRTLFLIFIVLIFSILIPYLLVRMIKRKAEKESTTLGSTSPLIDVDITGKPRKTMMSRIAASSATNEENIYNALASTRAIARDLKMKGMDIHAIDDLLTEAEVSYTKGSHHEAMMYTQRAKDLLSRKKSELEESGLLESFPTGIKEEAGAKATPLRDDTGFSDIEEDEEADSPELIDEKDMKKPDNYLPAKFTISMAEKAMENARSSGIPVAEPERLLLSAKAALQEEDYDEAFKFALRSKKESEALLGAMPSEEKRGISDLSVASSGKGEELMVCCVCGENRVPYISIEIEDGVEATCEECYSKQRTVISEKIEGEEKRTFKLKKKEEEIKEVEEEKEEPEEKAEKKCKNCGTSIKVEDVFCGKCGKPSAEEMKCHGCGTPVEPGDVFCRKCGARLLSE